MLNWLGIWLTMYPMSFIWPPILERIGGVLGTSWALSTALQASVNVCILSWLTVPLVVKLLGAWLDRPRPASFNAAPWKQLDEGLPRDALGLALRAAICILVYAPLIVVVILKRAT